MNEVEYKVYRLTSGEELISKSSTDMFTVTMERPAAIVIVPNKQDESQMEIMFVPFMPYTKDGTIQVKVQQIGPEAYIADKLISEYKRLFWPEELVMPTTKPVIMPG